MKRTPSPQNQEPDQEIIDLLKRLESHQAEYPPELLAARRADFQVQIKQARSEKTRQALALNGQFTKRLKELQAVKADYPAKLLAARRAAFIAQVEERNAAQAVEESAPKDQEILKLFKTIKSTETEYQYPAKLMAARRSAFRRQIALGEAVSFLETLRASIRKLFLFKVKMPSMPAVSLMRTSLIIAVLMVAAFATSLLRDREQVLSPAPSQGNVSQPVSSPTATHTAGIITIVCQPGDESPMCPPEDVDDSQDLAVQGNGEAKPAVAKDAVAADNEVHKASAVNDGHEGGGWVSNSAYSWIKIDLGKVATINTVTLDKASLDTYKDRNLGQFVIAVALSDVYADGNSSNDYTEYTQVYDSEQTNFNGVVSESATIRAMFRPVRARFVKITFEAAGTAIDEVKVFMAQPFGFVEPPTRRPKDDSSASQATPAPIYPTPLPANTAIPAPTNTAIPAPTRTPVPTDPPPTRTPLPTDPPPTRTPRPPTSTPEPTDTDIPPTDVPPTDIPPTGIPPTDVPPTEIPPTDVPPVDTPMSLWPLETNPPSSEASTEVEGT
jgi:hypothetical protein